MCVPFPPHEYFGQVALGPGSGGVGVVGGGVPTVPPQPSAESISSAVIASLRISQAYEASQLAFNHEMILAYVEHCNNLRR